MTGAVCTAAGCTDPQTPRTALCPRHGTARRVARHRARRDGREGQSDTCKLIDQAAVHLGVTLNAEAAAKWLAQHGDDLPRAVDALERVHGIRQGGPPSAQVRKLRAKIQRLSKWRQAAWRAGNREEAQGYTSELRGLYHALNRTRRLEGLDEWPFLEPAEPDLRAAPDPPPADEAADGDERRAA